MLFVRLRVLATVLLLTAAPLVLWPEDAPGTAAAAAPPTQDATLTAQTLAAALPQVPEVTLDGATVRWRDDDSEASVTIVGLDAASGDPLITTAIGPLRVPLHLIADHHTEVLAVLPALIAQARTLGMSAGALTLQLGMLTGPSLHGHDQVLVVPEGVLRPQVVAVADRSAEITRLATLSTALTAALPATTLDALACTTLTYLIAKLPGRDGGEALDEFPPSFARRVVSHGYLRPWFPADGELVAEAEQAVAAAGTVRATRIQSGSGLSLSEMRDAFGTRAWIYRRPDLISYGYQEPRPGWLGEHAPTLMVVVDLPAGCDPAHDAGRAVAARIYDNASNLLGSWSPAQGLVADPVRWRAAMGIAWPGLAEDTIPPHVLIRSLDGDVATLVVAAGLVHPPADGSPAEGERFLTDAARLLPDQAHLDLIGEYLFRYAFTSPEATHPGLIGERTLISDVQRTAAQTVADCAGGIMHGNCADIAELYQNLVERQHHHAIVIGLPQHAACCWASQEDGAWQVRILQTGMPLAFQDPSLPQALKQAYTCFDPAMAFDLSALPLLLRFSGEATRSAFTLSYRIFSEPAYCQTLVEVQRDLQYQTYQRGIATMTRLVASGDEDTANYLELSGLYSHTGQYAKSAAACAKAIAHSDSPTSRLNLATDTIAMLLMAGRQQEALAVARNVLNVQLPAVQSSLGTGEMRVLMSLVGACMNLHNGPNLHPLALKVMDKLLVTTMSQYIASVTGSIQAGTFKQDIWISSPGGRALRSLLSEYCALGMALLDELGPAGRDDPQARRLAATLQDYLDELCFRDVEEPSNVMNSYATLGRWYGLTLGAAVFEPMLEQAVPARAGSVDHAQRIPGPALLARDLRWIRASVPYWNVQLFALFARDRDKVDPLRLQVIAKHLQEAVVATTALGLADRRTRFSDVLAREMVALIGCDPVALRTAFRDTSAEQDKYLRDAGASWLGQSARFLDPAWFAQALQIWREEVDYKPKYFLIAWSAAVSHAPVQALMVAALAAARYPDDASFAEENDYMKALLAPGATPAAAGGPTQQPSAASPLP